MSERYEDDSAWYSVDWKPDPRNPDHEIGTAGFRLELLGGPLAGRMARLRDDRFRLWVTQLADSSHAILSAMQAPSDLPPGARLLGSYGFSQRDEAMTWRAEPGAG